MMTPNSVPPALAIVWTPERNWKPADGNAEHSVLASSNQLSDKVRDKLLGLARDRARRKDLPDGWLLIVVHGAQVVRREKFPLTGRGKGDDADDE